MVRLKKYTTMSVTPAMHAKLESMLGYKETYDRLLERLVRRYENKETAE